MHGTSDALRDNEDVDVGSNSKLANSSWNGGLAGMLWKCSSFCEESKLPISLLIDLGT